MPERECMHVVVQDPSLVVRACHECLGLLLRCDIEFLIIDSLEGALNDYISIPLGLEDTLVQVDVLHAHSLSIDYHIARTPFAALCITCFSSTKQYIFGLSPTNSVIRCP